MQERLSSLEEMLRSRGWRIYESLVEEQAQEAVNHLFHQSTYLDMDSATIARFFLSTFEFVRACRNVEAIPRMFIADNTEEE